LTAELPVLRTEVVTIPGNGKVLEQKGAILVLKKTQRELGYRKLEINDTINDGDIIILEESSLVVLKISGKSNFILKSNDESRWYTIKVEPMGKIQE